MEDNPCIVCARVGEHGEHGGGLHAPDERGDLVLGQLLVLGNLLLP